MASIQQLGIIHNDLKSANVLLDQIKHTSGGYILRGFLFLLLLFLCFPKI